MREDYDLSVYHVLFKELKVCELTTGYDETIIRCPFCGDSKKDVHDHHLYINNNPPFKYYCHLCEEHGIVDSYFLKNISIYNDGLSSYLNETKSKYLRNLNIKYGSTYSKYFENKKKIIIPNEYNELEESKLKYIEGRLGIKIDDEDLIERYKIVLNNQDFYENNEVKIPTDKEKRFLDRLNKEYVGFLNSEQTMITYRRFVKKDDKYLGRYINLPIFKDSLYDPNKMYAISNDVNLASNVFNINLTEGIFDIIGVYNHLYNCNMNSNDLFLSCNGKSYKFVLKELQKKSILNAEINIFSDKDVSVNKIKKFLNNSLLAKFNGYEVYYNNMGNNKKR
jgi:hypothetical protein